MPRLPESSTAEVDAAMADASALAAEVAERVISGTYLNVAMEVAAAAAAGVVAVAMEEGVLLKRGGENHRMASSSKEEDDPSAAHSS